MDFGESRPSTLAWAELRPESAFLFRELSGGPAVRYIEDSMLPRLGQICRVSPSPDAIAEALIDPVTSLRAALAHYAFRRRGRDRGPLSESAERAIEPLDSKKRFDAFLREADATSLRNRFSEECRKRGVRPQDSAAAGVVSGIAEMTQELRQSGESGSLFEWIASGIRRTGRVEPQFLRLMDLRGILSRTASEILRDAVFLFDLEDRLEPADRLYLQPIDKWSRAIAPYVVDEPFAHDLADWILAGKLAKSARRADVSGVRFSMGVRWFGTREVKATEFLDAAVRGMVSARTSPPHATVDLR